MKSMIAAPARLIRMRPGISACVLVLILGGGLPASAATYQCLRPDKTVVGTVTTDSGDPDVVCNHDYKSCNLVCTAVERLVREGKEAVWGASSPGAVTIPDKNPAGTAKEVIEKGLTQ
jgi:hypothetical protein